MATGNAEAVTAAATPTTKGGRPIPAFVAGEPAKDNDGKVGWVALLSPQDKLTYWTAYQTWDQAQATYQAAEDAAIQARAKYTSDFGDAQGAAIKAADALDAAVKTANDKKNAISATPGAKDLDASKIRADPVSAAAAQLAAITAAVADYQKAVAAIAPAKAAFAAAMTALQKLSDLGTFNATDPTKATENAGVADAQRDIAIAKAAPAREAAENTFYQARFQLWSTLDD